MLDEAAASGIAVTNLALQKLLYFVHAHHLIETKKPLISGYFEAWKFGPVHPAAYAAFKEAGNQPISFRAERKDPLTGRKTPLVPPSDPDVRQLVLRVMVSYGRLTPGRLVDISHAQGAPWSFVVDQASSNMAFGMRIGQDVILERFKFHKVSVGTDPAAGETIEEDSPFT